jgi:hypothetical protein
VRSRYPLGAELQRCLSISADNTTPSMNDSSANEADEQNTPLPALMSWSKKRMNVFVTIERDDDGHALVIPNAIKAAVMDPQYSRETCSRLGDRDLIDIRDAIIGDTIVLFSDDVQDVIGSQMPLGWASLLVALDKGADGNMDGEGCLAWWHKLSKNDAKKGNIHSNWVRSARMYLAMPAGGAPSEVGFSSTGEMVTKKRNLLGDKTLEQMTIIRHYVCQPGFDFNNLVELMGENATAVLDAIETPM